MSGMNITAESQDVFKSNVARLARLDGLRGAAATGVMVHHIFFFFAVWQFTGGPVAQVAEWIHQSGWTFVDLFFVLSGYVFAHVYLRGDELRTQEGLTSFWVARFARLWPLHLTMLLLIAALHPASSANTPIAFVAHLFMLQAFVLPVAGTFDWSSWSLTVEVFCYAIFSIADARGRKTLLWVTAMMIVVAILGLALMSQPGGPHAGGVFRRGLLGFFIGQAMWHGRARLTKIPAPVLVLAALAGLWFQIGPYTPVLPLTLLTWPAVLLLALRVRAMELPAMTWLGDRSYAIYLINLPLTQAVVSICAGRVLGTAQIVAIQAAIAFTVLLSADLAFRWIEKPSRIAIRHYWARRSERAASAVRRRMPECA